MADTVATAIYKMGVEGKESVDAGAASVDKLAVSEERLTKATRTSTDAVDRLLGRLDPRIRAEQQLQAALAQVNRFEEEGIGTAAQRAQAIDAATLRYSQAIQRLSGNNAAGTFLGAGNAAKLSAFQLQNLSFQMQDVGQAILTGQPLFRTFIQQGSQIAQIFGPGVGVAGAIKSVGTGILTYLLNPLNLAVFAFAAATAGAVALFGMINSEGKSAEEVLKKNKEVIDAITKAWGENAAAARAVGVAQADMLQTSALIAQLDLTKALTNERLKLAAAAQGRTGLIHTDSFGNPFANWHVPEGLLADAQKFREDFAKGVTTATEYRKQLDQIGATFPTSENLAFIESEKGATQAAYDLEKQQNALGNALNGTTSRVIAMTDALRSAFGAGFGSDLLRQGLAGSSANIDFAGRFDPASAAAKAAEEASKKSIAAADAHAKAIQSVKDALAFEEAQLGRTSVEQEIYNRLKQAGVDITSKDGMAIAATTRMLYEQQEALKQFNEIMDAAKGFAQDFGSTLIDDFLDGKSAIDSLSDAIGDLGRKLLDLALNQAINGLFSSLTGILGGTGQRYNGIAYGVGTPQFHTGGIVGSTMVPTRFVHPAYFENAPRLHGGTGGLAWDEMAAILKRGERVIPAGGGTGGSHLTVNHTVINKSDASVRTEERQDASGNLELVTLIDKAVAKNMSRRGSETNRVMRLSGAEIQSIRRG